MSDQADQPLEDEFGPCAWPDVPRVAFGPGKDESLDARLDWVRSERDRGLAYYLRAYEAAIDALYERVVAGTIVVEYALFPLAFLWRHRVELFLKDVIAAGQELWCEEPVVNLDHDLLRLWRQARPYIEPLGPADAPELANVEDSISEFQRIDPGADGFRYPLGRKGSQSLASAPERVNLAALHEAMEALANFLSGVRMELGRRVEYFLEHEHEMAKEYGPASPESIRRMRHEYMSPNASGDD